jgi:membrane fusion protein, multidrug efflux system
MTAKKWLFGVGVLILIGVGAFAALREGVGPAGSALGVLAALRERISPAGSGANSGAPPVRPVPVTIGTVEVKDFPIYLIALGTVQAFNTVTVRARVDGEVQKIAFREGQDVRAGDLLAQIDPRPYAAQLQQAEADKKRDEALLANAKLDLDRYTMLLVKDFATRQSVDTQKALVAQYQAAIAHDEAVIDNAKVQLGYTTITSPLAGRLGLRLIDQGNIVHATDSTGLLVVTQVQPIAVIFTLPQQHLLPIAEAMRRGELTVVAFDEDNKIKLAEGHLALIDNQIDQGTGSIRLKAIFPNEDNKLWPGEFVNAWLQLDVGHGPVVPDSVVQVGSNGDFAFLVKQDQSVEVRPVRVRASHDGQTLLEAGLAPGDRVVVDGQYKVRPGILVISANAAAAVSTPRDHAEAAPASAAREQSAAVAGFEDEQRLRDKEQPRQQAERQKRDQDVALLPQDQACKQEAEQLKRLRASLNGDEVIRFERALTCEKLRPQVLRLRESLLGDAEMASRAAPAPRGQPAAVLTPREHAEAAPASAAREQSAAAVTVAGKP